MSISGIVCKFLPDLSLPSFESNIIGASLSLYQDFFVAGLSCCRDLDRPAMCFPEIKVFPEEY